MIKFISFILRCWWWVYYGAWNAGEWIVSNPVWLSRHSFEMLLLANFPLVFTLLSVAPADNPDLTNQHDPLSAVNKLAELIINATPVIFWVDKAVLLGLVAVWFVHMLFALFVWKE